MSCKHPVTSLLVPLLLSAIGLACAPARAASYVDASSYLDTDAGIEAWYGVRAGLKQDFDEICGDTFCEGEYSNIESLRYRCSVNAFTGRIGMCVWVFAASEEEIDPATGRIRVVSQAWHCRTPLAPRTRIEELLVALHGDAPLHASLPGTTRSIYDGLGDCL